MKVGDKAPDYLGTDQDGKEIRLSDYKGKKVVLYFYPKDSTPGCTSEACNLRDNYELMLKRGYVVIGVSIQDEKSHKKFIEKTICLFHLIADVDKKLNETLDIIGGANKTDLTTDNIGVNNDGNGKLLVQLSKTLKVSILSKM